jgi:large repetitive protein
VLYGSPVPNEAGTVFSNGITGASNPAGANNSDGTLRGLTLAAGTNYPQQSLPVDPTGIVYDSVSRQPVSGAVVAISGPPGFDPALHLVGGASNASQTTGADGSYQFLLLPNAPVGNYSLTVTAPQTYQPTPSTLIPPCTGAVTVGATPNPALMQASNAAPAVGVAAHNPAVCEGIVGGGSNSTQYFTTINFNPASSANLVNNHIAVDPILSGALVLTKTTPLVNVARGDLVPYSITATNTLSATLGGIEVRDQFPAGFQYRAGSASVDGLPVEPTVSGRRLSWANLSFGPLQKRTFKLILVVGSGVGEGEFTNSVVALNSLAGREVSNTASATVRVVPDPTFDCSDIVGKVFDDENANGYEDQGEPGIANVRLATARGLLVSTDADGRFHVPCAAVPNAIHGSNFVMKLDDRTLPSGYRVTTENPRDVRVTRGKMTKLNFGATIHRVVRIEVSRAAFQGDGVDLSADWAKKFDELPAILKDKPSVARIAYRLSGEPRKLAQRRLHALTGHLRELWRKQDCCYQLIVEDEIQEAAR